MKYRIWMRPLYGHATDQGDMTFQGLEFNSARDMMYTLIRPTETTADFNYDLRQKMMKIIERWEGGSDLEMIVIFSGVLMLAQLQQDYDS